MEINPLKTPCGQIIIILKKVTHTIFSPYWAVQAGLLIPLTFTRHHLSPLAIFTSSVYFLYNGGCRQWIREVYSANFKGIVEGPCHTLVSGNKQKLVARVEKKKKKKTTTKNSTRSRFSGQRKDDTKTLYSPHSLSLFPYNSCKHCSIGIFTAWQF